MPGHPRKSKWTPAVRGTVALLMLFSLILPGRADPDPVAGIYQATRKTGAKNEKMFLEVTIREEGDRYYLSGSGGYSTGRSVAPDFSGKGYSPKMAPWKFSFEDSFGNKGTAFATPTKSGVKFSVAVSEVREPRCLPFYEEINLRRKK